MLPSVIARISSPRSAYFCPHIHNILSHHPPTLIVGVCAMSFIERKDIQGLITAFTGPGVLSHRAGLFARVYTFDAIDS